MKKLLLSSVAVCGLTLAAAPAMAGEGVKLDVGGWFKGYGVYVDQDTTGASKERSFDFLNSTEVHFTGETVLDNGLTVGAHIEAEADNNDSAEIEESYIYMVGDWGRVNFGAENGATYLLQVSAPSGDSNLDGIRQYFSPMNYTLTDYSTVLSAITANQIVVDAAGGAVGDVRAVGALTSGSLGNYLEFDYDDDVSGYSNKLTYMTPVFEGFQFGVSYSPELDSDGNRTNGVNADDEAGDYGDVYEIAMRYAGEFDGFGIAVGAGFTHAELEATQNFAYVDVDGSGTQNAGDTAINREDRQSWNVGLDMDFGAFGLGAAYVEDDQGVDADADTQTFVVGGDYKNGPWKLGVSYYNQDQELFGADEVDTDRYTGGVVYNYGPGMTFRGSISYIDHEAATFADTEATSVMLGTQIKF